MTYSDMTRFPDTYQAINQKAVRDMRAFLVEQLTIKDKDERWVRRIWSCFENYPLYDDIKDRLDVLWHHVFNPAVMSRDFKLAFLFVEMLSTFIESHEGASVLNGKLQQYQDALSAEEQISSHSDQKK